MTTSVQTAGQASPTIQPSQLQQQQTPAAASTVDDDQKQEQPPTQEKHLPPDTNAIATISNKLPPPAADITSLSATSSDPDAPSDSVSYDDQYEGHREVKQLLESCRLLQYLDTFLNEGFDSLRSVMEVTEDDMIAMKVKRGHRRLIQREIATAKGIPRHQPLVITTISRTGSAKQRSNSSDMVSDTLPTSTTPSSSTSVKGKQPTTQQQRAAAFNHNISTEAKPVGLPNQAASGSSNDDDEEDEEDMYEDSASSRSHSGNSKMMMMPPKRRYRRHPKPDKNAPVKPPSAYIMFSNSARTQLKDQNLSFAELAKVVGDKWKNLSMAEKQAYEHAAAEAKNEYLISLEHYRKTPEYKKYQIYLRDFRNKQDAANRLAANSIRKRSKAIASPSR
ncbi:hypothetical protein BCR43DRAFT_446145 [Syncephalastrum racemosum]|uniref:HMG box domain-containing protein n=1 Tax=Syncephalastrum racemosum TaxID=13706 RepID=A0A1X2H3A9_SYNRA|nr:hypothetical protein BCR43DRAFT_446145 [Syncephalastrum racemosum]